MSLESALSYIRRMREDNAFRHAVNALSEDDAASWAFLKENGYEFSMAEFRAAQDETYKEHGITPM